MDADRDRYVCRECLRDVYLDPDADARESECPDCGGRLYRPSYAELLWALALIGVCVGAILEVARAKGLFR